MFLGVQFVQFMFLGVNPSNNVIFFHSAMS